MEQIWASVREEAEDRGDGGREKEGKEEEERDGGEMKRDEQEWEMKEESRREGEQEEACVCVSERFSLV